MTRYGKGTKHYDNMAKEQVTTTTIDKLVPDDKNFNKGTEYGKQLLGKSFAQFGAGRSILLDKNNRIIAGNKATEEYGEQGGEKVIVVETDGTTLVAVKRTDIDLDSKRGRELALADNATQKADLEWDTEVVEAVSKEWEIDAKAWGVEVPDELGQTEAKEDDFDADAEVETRCKLGDIWQLGEHRLMCGDSTKAEDVAKLMNGEKADIVITSPPYNAGSINQDGNESTKPKYGEYEDEKTGDDYLSFISSNLSICLQNANEVFYNIGLVSGNKREIFKLVNAYIDKFKDVIYWEKTTAAPCIADGVVNNLVEFILCFGHNNSRRFENAQFGQGTYWNVIKGNNASGNEYAKIHKATFPVYLPENIIRNFCPINGMVLDTFGGTGTTMIAAEQLGRKSRLMEIDPHYCDIILARWDQFTGKTAVKI